MQCLVESLKKKHYLHGDTGHHSIAAFTVTLGGMMQISAREAVDESLLFGQLSLLKSLCG